MKSTFFTYEGKRKSLVGKSEQNIILERIAIAKENAGNKYVTSAPLGQKSEEENKMTASFNLGAMLGGNDTVSDVQSQVQQIPCDMLIPYHNHPFKLYEGERLDDMEQSIKENGVLIPIIVQPNGAGKYEILIGHNRWNASKRVGKLTVPAIVKDGLTPEEAEMYVVESNLMQRGFDNLKISEQAAVIASRYEKMFSQGKRTDIIKELQAIENPGIQPEEDKQTKPKNSREKVGEEYGLSRNSVARLLRINKLILGLKNLVDDGNIPIRAAVDLSYLTEKDQNMVVNPAKKFKVDMKKAELLRNFSEAQGLNLMTIIRILNGTYLAEQKPPKPKTVKLSNDIYCKYFKEDVQPDEVAQTITNALELYFSNNKERN